MDPATKVKVLAEQWINVLRVVAAEQVIEGKPSKDKEILFCKNLWDLAENLHWQNDYQAIIDKRSDLFASRWKIERVEKTTPLYNEIIKLMPKKGELLTQDEADKEWKAFKETQKTIRNGPWNTSYNKLYADNGPPSGTHNGPLLYSDL